GLGEAAESGRQGAFNAMVGRTTPAAASAGDDVSSMPRWARAMKNQASARYHRQAAIHAVGQGDRGGAGATPDIKERDD
ncbi:MAG: P-type conjugative transfer protein TrbL, partial [Rhizorhabdus sp.]|nr:P-type conjugative transfer protein TrbL [Rhizorhabdus sp.]